MHHLRHNAYVKLAPSGIAGVGVFALVDIPEGADPFQLPNAHLREPEAQVNVQLSELRSLPPPVLEHLLDFHEALDPDEGAGSSAESPSATLYGLNATGTVSMDASWYINHSDTPNVVPAAPHAGSDFNCFRTLRKVKAGEEVLCDYRMYAPGMYQRCVGRGSACDGSVAESCPGER